MTAGVSSQPGTTADALVRVRGLSFAFGKRVIFDNVDMDIRRGQVTALMGPSGTGKTTLLRLIGGVLRPQAGSVQFDGQEVPALKRDDLLALRKRMGIMFQQGALLTDLNVYDNVAFPMREHTALPESMIRDLVLLKLDAVGLRGAQSLWPHELSGGMARRVAMARAIALDPELVMYDEPLTGLDPISMGVATRLMRTLNDALGLTSIVVSHDVAEVMAISDYAYVASGGKIVAQGKPADVYASKSEWAQQFLKGEPDGPVRFHYDSSDYAQDLMAA